MIENIPRHDIILDTTVLSHVLHIRSEVCGDDVYKEHSLVSNKIYAQVRMLCLYRQKTTRKLTRFSTGGFEMT